MSARRWDEFLTPDGSPRPSITLDIYAHEFEEARGKDDIADRLADAFGA